ncbi:hypothetical protein CW304_12020 [Bacillus sp. UFRGS-B20]|nr:hypothetical protein CW304_12020 [Bacillus sp. UFRGS-B20]
MNQCHSSDSAAPTTVTRSMFLNFSCSCSSIEMTPNISCNSFLHKYYCLFLTFPVNTCTPSL